MILELPSNFYVGHLIGRKGNTIRDIQELTGAKLNIQKNANTGGAQQGVLRGPGPPNILGEAILKSEKKWTL